jgi:hypothetical protein
MTSVVDGVSGLVFIHDRKSFNQWRQKAEVKGKAVPLHAMEALGREEV